jgi:hypothetical protein
MKAGGETCDLCGGCREEIGQEGVVTCQGGAATWAEGGLLSAMQGLGAICKPN